MNFKKATTRILAVCVAVCFILGPGFVGNIVAKPIMGESQLGVVANEVKSELTEKVLQDKQFKSLKDQYEFETNNVVVKQFSEADESKYVVRVPIKDNTGYNYSAYAVFFDKEKNNPESILFHFNKSENDLYHFTAITKSSKLEADIKENGEIVNGTSIDSSGVSQDLKSILEAKKQAANTPDLISKIFTIKTALADGFWSCMNSCLAGLGVPSWIIAALGVACAAVCVGTAGTACLLCLKAAQVVLTAEITYCFGQCW